MIYDTLSHIDRYEGMHPGVMAGLRFLAQTDFSALPDGRVEIDGQKVFANIMTFETKSENKTPEAHRKYIDIQYLISGRERMDAGPLEDMDRLVEARPQNDIWFYEGTMVSLTLGEGRFAVLFPGDAHAPGIAPEKPETVRKVVVKVLTDWE